tara:strand:- start:82 stop:258 length:177 start_codon:yes stop_codon:yes gene_type:complete
MTLQEFVDSYRIATAGSYYERLDEAQLFVSDAEGEVSESLSEIVAYAAAIYDVKKSDI